MIVARGKMQGKYKSAQYNSINTVMSETKLNFNHTFYMSVYPNKNMTTNLRH